MNNTKGITLISLVVTIAILIILTGVTLRLTLGGNGLLQLGENTSDEYKMQTMSKEIEVKAYEFIKQKGRDVTVDEFIEDLVEKNIVKPENVFEIDDDITYVKIDDYMYSIERLQEKKIKVSYINKSGTENSSINILQKSKTSNSITVKFEVKNADFYIMYVKKQGEEYKKVGQGIVNYQEMAEKISGLKQDTVYYIKIEAYSDNDNKIEVEDSIKTNAVETLTTANTTITYSESDWTKGPVVATVETSVTGYSLQTSRDGINWEYKKKQTYTENGTVYVRLIDNAGQEGESTTGNIDKIDKVAPAGSITLTATTNTIKVTVNANDIAKTSTNGCSGIKGYYYSKDNGTTYTELKTSNIYTFENLTQTQLYNIKVKVEDNAGNICEIDDSKETETVTALTSSNTKFTYSKTSWTNENITATASTEVTGFTLQTSKDGTNWSNSSSQTFTENGVVYARLIDSTGQEGGSTTGNIDKIDKLEPNTFTPTVTSTTNSITIKASTTDQDATTSYGKSDGIQYRFSKDNGSNYTSYQSSGTYTFNDLKQTTTYNIKIQAKDAAGNVTTVSESKKTGTVTALTSSNTTFTYNKTSWTNGNITATASTTVTGFTLQTSKDGTNWSNEVSQTFTANGTVYARLIDSTGQEGGSTTGNIDKIDKTAPNNASITFTSTSATTSGNTKATVQLSDALSGVQVSKCKWTYNTNSAKIGTEDSSYGNTFTSQQQTLTLSTSTIGTYYLHVLTVDNAGNRAETVSSAVTVKNDTIKICIVEDYRYENKGGTPYKDTLNKYFVYVDYDKTKTLDQLKATNYNVYISMSEPWAITRPTIINGLFSAGKNIFTMGNDNSKSLSIINDNTNITSGYTANRVLGNAVTNSMGASISVGSDSQNIIHFKTGVEKWYTATYNNATYDFMGCWTGSSSNKWIHYQGLDISQNNVKNIILYLAGSL